MKVFTVMLGGAAALAVAVAALMIGEALWVGVFASEAQVAEYLFGSEAMVEHGGYAYESLTIYVASGLARAAALLAIAFAWALSAVRNWRRPLQPRRGTERRG